MSDKPGNGASLLDPPPSPALQAEVNERFRVAQRELNIHALQLDRIEANTSATLHRVDQALMRLGPIETDVVRCSIAQEQTTRSVDEMAVQLRSLVRLVGGLRTIVIDGSKPQRRRVKTGATRKT